MSLPKPPFHSKVEELLYNIYLRLPDTAYLTADDINTIAKLNALIQDADLLNSSGVSNAINDLKGNVPDTGNTLAKLYNIIQGLTYLSENEIDTLSELNAVLTDADLVREEDLSNAITNLKGNVPVSGNTLEKLYGIIQGLTQLKREDIDTLAELNAVLTDADLVRVEDLSNAITALKGNVPVAGNTLEKLYGIIQGLTHLKREDIDTLAELNAVLTDADLVRVEDLVNAINGLKGNVPVIANTLEKLYGLIQTGSKNRIIQFEFKSNQFAEHRLLFKGQINSLAHDFTNELSTVSYKSRLDTSDSWVQHPNLATLQTWINSNITGNEITGTKYWIKCVATYKSGQTEEAGCILYYLVN
jgi:hypothetical protein